MEIKTKARKWGSSLAVILPKAVVDTKKIRENDELTIEVKKMPLASEFFGRFQRLKKPTQKIKDEMRAGW